MTIHITTAAALLAQIKARQHVKEELKRKGEGKPLRSERHHSLGPRLACTAWNGDHA
jgi:hypothetical protein